MSLEQQIQQGVSSDALEQEAKALEQRLVPDLTRARALMEALEALAVRSNTDAPRHLASAIGALVTCLELGLDISATLYTFAGHYTHFAGHMSYAPNLGDSDTLKTEFMQAAQASTTLAPLCREAAQALERLYPPHALLVTAMHGMPRMGYAIGITAQTCPLRRKATITRFAARVLGR